MKTDSISKVSDTLSALKASAQSVEWDQTFRESGKIYVVVGVVTIIFLGLIIYLFTQDKRISKIEKELKK